MIEFFTDPWYMELMHWTMVQIVSALIQIGAVYGMFRLALHILYNVLENL